MPQRGNPAGLFNGVNNEGFSRALVELLEISNLNIYDSTNMG